jgi:release factor glutamine methyltransferase
VTTVAELLLGATDRLRTSGSESPRLDAELLLASVLGIDRTGLIVHSEAPVGEGPAAELEALVVRREAGEPVAYLRGLREFHGLAFAVDSRALIPRPETEQLVDLAEAEVANRLVATYRAPGAPPIRVVDVGTGSGAIAVALAVGLRRRRMLEDVRILATDDADDAVGLARENAVGHAVADRIRFVVADLIPTDEPPQDVIVANLPYVATAALEDLPAAVTFEPRHALDGGPDGLALIRRLVSFLPDVLAAGGVAFLEIGADQSAAIRDVVGELPGGWRCEVTSDLAGHPRVARVER